MTERLIPNNPLEFIRDCVSRRDILWTYHVNMRLTKRAISRDAVVESIDAFEVIEEYPDDKYLPSYLVYLQYQQEVFHILFAADVAGKNVRVVTAYRPDPRKWSTDLKQRIVR